MLQVFVVAYFKIFVENGFLESISLPGKASVVVAQISLKQLHRATNMIKRQ